MSVVIINAIHVPDGAGPDLEQRLAARKHAVDTHPGFEGFQLLRPIAGESRYFVVTQWASQADFEAWRNGPAKEALAGQVGQRPIATGADLMQFEVGIMR